MAKLSKFFVSNAILNIENCIVQYHNQKDHSKEHLATLHQCQVQLEEVAREINKTYHYKVENNEVQK